ncbi:uncharacterized protein LOC131056574 isoform X2 [Cryptomeria japonica]|uniref:uncharacterized protein LOC131056574 isoform X2 n=1 Tax=Cryptomeria japonica TaxID=3369 RepID=UPI0027DA55F2|nr:uncharacterized protein LOC131056574 isoform X2 [Cryptomeria japonica]
MICERGKCRIEMLVLQNVALPRNSLFGTIQTRPITAFRIQSCQGTRSRFDFVISMLDNGKDNGIQENLKEKHNQLSLKQNPSDSFGRFHKGSGLGDGSHAPVQDVLEEVLSTKAFVCDDDLTEQFTERNKQGTLIELNVALLRQQDPSQPGKAMSVVISFRTMAEQTLGKWGGYVSTINYIFLSYTVMVAHISKSGEVLSSIIQIPASIAGALFACIFGILVLVGGTKATDTVNQLLTACLIGLFLFIVATFLGGWSGINHMDWDLLPQTVPVILFSLVYHDIIPVLCAYLGGDISRIRTSIIFGSMVPLAVFLVWDAAALGVAPISGGEDPLDSLLRLGGSNFSYFVQLFSLVAIATSSIGSSLGLMEFFLEQLSNFKMSAVLRRNTQITTAYMIYPKARHFITLLHPFKNIFSRLAYRANFGRSFPYTMARASKMGSVLNRWWLSNGLRLASFALVIFPPVLISSFVGNAFFSATDIAGTYGMMTLYGIFPPAMAWAWAESNDKLKSEDSKPLTVPGGRFALAGIGLCASGVVLNQLFLDLAGMPLQNIVDNGLITEISNVISTVP